ncbi:uncharacterized protein NDAI_0C00510 [Naumovozyma dairenensis CBS 421]|uniref:MADS-box domain-containing protein n=1 Tax=Naumovozyma dairenensis (strain ATCC 10597 / BCRC 20456 / CBS 421 / NBRC 0211 / NRRL Y-12639) TaxID=1071378 RepID=G0W7F1_NAUDC|nr:hypothetical protein NDAI_0C00510 [Naumovozyma dairenensis CBS 421]CCD23712.1 hypothetical protein NDAI_0C00510 [Naumovozyma dairenensis CBS 421]
MSDTNSKTPIEEPSTKERRKIEIKFIENKTRRHVTFSKRKHGIMKKAFELSVLTGTQVLLLVVSETGLVYTFSTPKFEPIVTQQEGRNLIQACLNVPDEEEEEEEDEDPENEGTNGMDTRSGIISPDTDNIHPDANVTYSNEAPQAHLDPETYSVPANQQPQFHDNRSNDVNNQNTYRYYQESQQHHQQPPF